MIFFKRKASYKRPPIGARDNSINPVVLLSLDGWGIAPDSDGNPISLAKTPNVDYLVSNFPNGQLIASGEAVGLPANSDGNSEVGHLMMGAGRILLQSLKRINASIEDGSFYENEAFLKSFEHIKKTGGSMHLMGLVGSGSVHSSISHLFALIEFCRRRGLTNVSLHLITDGRDTPPKEAIEIVARIEKVLQESGVGRIASIFGRYYAMDRDRRWDRTERVYRALTEGVGNSATSAKAAVDAAYAKGLTDEFIEPTLISGGQGALGLVKNGDSVVFFNFRIDRPRQLTMAFALSNFEVLREFELGVDTEHGQVDRSVSIGKTFTRKVIISNLFFVTMTEYQAKLSVSAVAFPPETVSATLPEVLSKKGLKQMHMAESEKERMVTYYFDGLREGSFSNEDVLIVPSLRIDTYDKRPEMSLFPLLSECVRYITARSHHFFVINFANPDMVAHSGNIKATVRACQYVDKAIGQLVDAVLSVNGTLIITADHGNAEELLTFNANTFYFTSDKGTVNTDHSNNPVPVIIVNNQFRGKVKKISIGTLSDIAPTILNIMKIEIPPEMTGRDLLA